MAKADFGSLPKRTHSAGVRAIHTQDGRDIITGVESSWLQLEASSRGEDEALIAEIVKQKMEKSKSNIVRRNRLLIELYIVLRSKQPQEKR